MTGSGSEDFDAFYVAAVHRVVLYVYAACGDRAEAQDIAIAFEAEQLDGMLALSRSLVARIAATTHSATGPSWTPLASQTLARVYDRVGLLGATRP